MTDSHPGMFSETSEKGRGWQGKPNGKNDGAEPGDFEARFGPPLGDDAKGALFPIERWEEISFGLDEEWLVDGVVLKRGVGLIYGPSGTFKSFIAMHLAISIAHKSRWAGRQVESAAIVYVGAEGAAGLRKRKAGYVNSGRAPASGLDFALVSAAPNLGTAPGDRDRLIATIVSVGMAPGLIVIDTAAKAISGADENGQGMAALLVNAEALAQHFNCFVLLVHHTGWGDDAQSRPRGWSGLTAGLDLMILCERRKPDTFATITLQKLKDEESGVQFVAHTEHVVLGMARTGREISTLVVDRVEMAQATATGGKPWPKSLVIFKRAFDEAMGDAGKITTPRAGMSEVRAVDRETVRAEFYRLYPGDTAKAKRSAFERCAKDAVERGVMCSINVGPDLGQTIFWSAA